MLKGLAWAEWIRDEAGILKKSAQPQGSQRYEQPAELSRQESSQSFIIDSQRDPSQ